MLHFILLILVDKITFQKNKSGLDCIFEQMIPLWILALIFPKMPEDLDFLTTLFSGHMAIFSRFQDGDLTSFCVLRTDSCSLPSSQGHLKKKNRQFEKEK